VNLRLGKIKRCRVSRLERGAREARLGSRNHGVLERLCLGKASVTRKLRLLTKNNLTEFLNIRAYQILNSSLKKLKRALIKLIKSKHGLTSKPLLISQQNLELIKMIEKQDESNSTNI